MQDSCYWIGIIDTLGRKIANKKKMIDIITTQRCILSPNHKGYRLNIKKKIVKTKPKFFSIPVSTL